MRTVPYLNFDGQCREAFTFYGELLGGVPEIMGHKDLPASAELGPEWQGLVMHAYLAVGDAVLMGSDSPPGRHEAPRGLSCSLHLTDAAEGERIFRALAEGGTVTMPFEKTFWAEGFGMAVDRFGIPWMVNCGAPT